MARRLRDIRVPRRPRRRRINHEKPNEYRDPFEVVGQAPKGRVYQWVAESIVGRTDLAASDLEHMKAGGWMPVPAKRHAKMPSRGNKIVLHGQVLMERSKKLDDKARADEIAKARSLKQETDKQFGLDRAEGGLIPLTFPPALPQEPATRSVEEVKQTLASTNGVFHVDVTLAVLISDREIDTAINVLHLDPAEYVRRRIVMDTSVLLRTGDAIATINRGFTLDYDKPAVFQRADISVRPKE